MLLPCIVLEARVYSLLQSCSHRYLRCRPAAVVLCHPGVKTAALSTSVAFLSSWLVAKEVLAATVLFCAVLTHWRF